MSSKTEKPTSENEGLVNGRQASAPDVSDKTNKSVPLPIRPKLKTAKSVEEISDNKLATNTPNTPVDSSTLNEMGHGKPVPSLNSANINEKSIAAAAETPGASEDEAEEVTPRNSSTDIIVCSGEFLKMYPFDAVVDFQF